MGSSRRRSLALAAIAAAVAIPAGALAAGGPGADPVARDAGPSAYDVRDTPAGQRLAARPSDSRRRAQRRLERSLGHGGAVRIDRTTGTPELVVDTSGFLTGRSNRSAGALSLGFVRRHDAAFGLDANDLDGLELVGRDTTPSGLTVLRWIQTYKGIPAFDNALSATVRDRRLVSVAGSPEPDLSVASTRPALSAAAAMRRALADVGVHRAVRQRSQRGAKRETKLTTGRAELTLFVEGRQTRLAWKLYAFADSQHVYLSVVDAASGRILKRANIVRHASGNALEYYPGSNLETGGGAAGGTLASKSFSTAPGDPWVTTPFSELSGDNALVFADVNDNNSESGTEDINPSSGSGTTSAAWSYTPVTDQSSTPIRKCPTIAGTGCTWNGDEYTGVFSPLNWQLNQNQAGTQLFWFVNNFHDYLEADAGIGFDDGSNNFEADGNGDRLIANVNDGANTGVGGFPDADHTNNANMSTFPSGSPLMQMYLFEGTDFIRDVNGSDDAGIVYHEYTHGLSERLVDPSGSGGLNTAQGGAMAEAWSDWYAFDYLVGQGLQPDSPGNDGEVVLSRYENGAFREQGIDCPLGTSDPDCPHGGYTYGDFGSVIPEGPEVHADGEIWAATLWDLRRALITAHGLATGELRTRTVVTDGIRISTGTQPSFLDMRDAILTATSTSFPTDLATVREVFRARGMGKCATTNGPDDTAPVANFTAFTATCGGTPPPPNPNPNPTPTPTTPTPTPTPSGPGQADFSGSKRSIRASRSGRFRISFRARAGLEGSAKFVTVKKVSLSAKKRRTLARRDFTVSATGVVTIRVKLSRRNRRILKRYKKLRVKLTVKLLNADNVTSTSTLRFTLKAPKPAP